MKSLKDFMTAFMAVSAFILVSMASSSGWCTELNVVGCEAGSESTYVLFSDGTMKACGLNENGQLGDVSYVNRTSLVSVSSNNYKCVSSNFVSTIAVMGNGTLYVWGKNNEGCFGDSSTFSVNSYYTTPTKSGSVNTWVKISSGSFHSLSLTGDGKLYAAGWNDFGQLGLGYTSARQDNFVQVGSDSDWVSISAGFRHSAAIKSDGTLWVWGYNNASYDYLGLGDISFNNVSTPTQVLLNLPSAEDNDWVKVVCGSDSTLALKSDGTLWSWGQNGHGELGQGNWYCYNTPTLVSGYSDWVDVATGGTHTLAIKSDGTLWGWGDNTYGQVEGDPDEHSYYLVPEQIGFWKHWIDIDAGYYHSVAVRANGRVWTWGRDNKGQLGRDDSTYDYEEPGEL